MKTILSIAFAALTLASASAFAQPIVTPRPADPVAHSAPDAPRRSRAPEAGPVEIAIQATGNITYTEISTESGQDVTLFVPNVEVGGWIGTGLGSDSTFGYAIGYHGRLSRAPAETAQRHAVSLGLLKGDGAVFFDVGFGLFDGDGDSVDGASALFGATVQAKLGGTGFSLVVPLYCDILVDPSVSAFATFGVGIGYTSL